MEYIITKLVLGFKEKIDITEDEFADLQNATKVLSAGLAIEEKYEVLLGNYEEFEKEILDLSVESMLNRIIDYEDFRNSRVKLNRRLINLLTAARLYVDHAKHHLSDISSDFQAVSDSCSAVYDNNFEYRFMEALRNYVQHRGFPVHWVSMQSGWNDIEDEQKAKMYSTVDFTTKKKWLIENGGFKQKILDELDESIDLKQSTRKYVECLSEIHDCVRKTISAKINKARFLVENKIEQFNSEYNLEISSLSAISMSEDKRVIKEVPLLLEWDDLRINLEQKNQKLLNLSRHYVTGETKIKN